MKLFLCSGPHHVPMHVNASRPKSESYNDHQYNPYNAADQVAGIQVNLILLCLIIMQHLLNIIEILRAL